MKTMREMMDDYFIEVYKAYNGHMNKTSITLGVSNRTSLNWRTRLISEGKLENITPIGNNSLILNRLKMYDEFCNKKTLKKGSHKFKDYDLA